MSPLGIAGGRNPATLARPPVGSKSGKPLARLEVGRRSWPGSPGRLFISQTMIVHCWFCMCQQTKDIRGLSATWKAWKVEAWNARQLTSAGQKAGQDDALTDLGEGKYLFCRY